MKLMQFQIDDIIKSALLEDINYVDVTTDYLIDEGTGKIRRGDWQSLEIVPDDLAYIKVSLMVQGFVQSRGDAVV